MQQPIHDARFSPSPLPQSLHLLRSECYAPSGAAKDTKQDKKQSISLPTQAPLALVTAGRFDILEHDDRYELMTDAPGFGASDISVELKDGVLTISGKREATRETKPAAAAGEGSDKQQQQQQQQQQPAGAKVWRRERVVQQFSCSFKLPDNAKPDDIAAHLDKGVLSVHVLKLPPAPKPQPKRIVVQSTPAHAAQAAWSPGS